MSDENPNPNPSPENVGEKASSCLGWLMLWGTLGVLAIVVAVWLAGMWGGREEIRQSRRLLAEQIERIRRGEINCLVEPDPRIRR